MSPPYFYVIFVKTPLLYIAAWQFVRYYPGIAIKLFLKYCVFAVCIPVTLWMGEVSRLSKRSF